MYVSVCANRTECGSKFKSCIIVVVVEVGTTTLARLGLLKQSLPLEVIRLTKSGIHK